MDIGRVCVKIAGRESGKKCVVVDLVDENYVLVSGPGVRRRRCNVGHLEPLEQKLEIKKGAPDEEVERALGVEREAKPKRLGKPKKLKKPKKAPKEKPPKEKEEPRKKVKPSKKLEKPSKGKTGEKAAEGSKAEG